MMSKEQRSNHKLATFKRRGYFGLFIILLSCMSFSIFGVTDHNKVEASKEKKIKKTLIIGFSND